MTFGVIEILAVALIIIAIVKLIVFLINPNLWFDLVERFYMNSAVASAIGLVASILVLYFILNAGVSIVEVLAICFFIALIIMTGLASYSDEILVWARSQNKNRLIKKLWLYWLIWILLLSWGIIDIFFI